jgi:hypothetical protein
MKELAIDTTFNPPWFSSDSTFKKTVYLYIWTQKRQGKNW